MPEELSLVIALSGRRIDPPGSEQPSFPLVAVDRVRQSLRDLFLSHHANTLVCSAACGADLVALEVAEDLGMRRRIVLPFEAGRFRRASVIDRPGDWGPLFDRMVATARAEDNLIDLKIGMKIEEESGAAYMQASEAIVRDAMALARCSQSQALGVLVWNLVSRGEGDVTYLFGRFARSLGCSVVEVSTLPQSYLLTPGAGDSRI